MAYSGPNAGAWDSGGGGRRARRPKPRQTGSFSYENCPLHDVPVYTLSDAEHVQFLSSLAATPIASGTISKVVSVNTKPGWASVYGDMVYAQFITETTASRPQEKLNNNMRVLKSLNRLRGYVKDGAGNIRGYLADKMPGVDTYEVLNKHPFPLDRHRPNIALSLGRALQAFHHLGWVHGDLRPENTMCDYNRVRGTATGNLIDFDTAIKNNTGRITQCTLEYRPPEFYPCGEGGPKHTQAFDIYSLGMTFCEVLFPDLYQKHWFYPIQNVREELKISGFPYELYPILIRQLDKVNGNTNVRIETRKASRLIIDMLQLDPKARPPIGAVMAQFEEIYPSPSFVAAPRAAAPPAAASSTASAYVSVAVTPPRAPTPDTVKSGSGVREPLAQLAVHWNDPIEAAALRRFLMYKNRQTCGAEGKRTANFAICSLLAMVPEERTGDLTPTEMEESLGSLDRASRKEAENTLSHFRTVQAFRKIYPDATKRPTPEAKV